MKELLQNKSTEERELTYLCCFEPGHIADFKCNCLHSVREYFPVVIDDKNPVFMVHVSDNGEKDWVKLAETPSRLRVSLFKAFQLSFQREVNADRQSVAVFGQAARSIGIMITAAYMSKIAILRFVNWFKTDFKKAMPSCPSPSKWKWGSWLKCRAVTTATRHRPDSSGQCEEWDGKPHDTYNPIDSEAKHHPHEETQD